MHGRHEHDDDPALAAWTEGEDVGDQGKWLKLWSSWTTDPEVSALPLADQARLLRLMSYVKVHGTSGVLEVLAPAAILCRQVEVAGYVELQALLARLPRRGEYQVGYAESKAEAAEGELFASQGVLLHVAFPNWQRQQGNLSTPRVQEHRDREREREAEGVKHPETQPVTGEKRREETRKEETRRDRATRIRFDHAAKEFVGIGEDDLKAWAATYPKVDIKFELASMTDWAVRRNPKKARTVKDWPAFIRNWMTEEQRKAPAAAPSRRTIGEEWAGRDEGTVTL